MRVALSAASASVAPRLDTVRVCRAPGTPCSGLKCTEPIILDSNKVERTMLRGTCSVVIADRLGNSSCLRFSVPFGSKGQSCLSGRGGLRVAGSVCHVQAIASSGNRSKGAMADVCTRTTFCSLTCSRGGDRRACRTRATRGPVTCTLRKAK